MLYRAKFWATDKLLHHCKITLDDLFATFQITFTELVKNYASVKNNIIFVFVKYIHSIFIIHILCLTSATVAQSVSEVSKHRLANKLCGLVCLLTVWHVLLLTVIHTKFNNLRNFCTIILSGFIKIYTTRDRRLRT